MVISFAVKIRKNETLILVGMRFSGRIITYNSDYEIKKEIVLQDEELPVSGKMHEGKLLVAFNGGINVIDPENLNILEKIPISQKGEEIEIFSISQERIMLRVSFTSLVLLDLRLNQEISK